jgi:hypothetical protein
VTLYYSLLLFFFCVLYCSLFVYCTVSFWFKMSCTTWHMVYLPDMDCFLCCVFCVLYCSVTLYYSLLLFFFCVLYCSLFVYCTVSFWFKMSCTTWHMVYLPDMDCFLCCVFSVLYCSVTLFYSVLLFFFCVLYCSFFLYCTVSACDVRVATLSEDLPCFFLSCKANVRV